MKAHIQNQIRRSISASVRSLMALFVFVSLNGFSQTLTQEFIDAGYTLTDLGSISQLPSKYGGLTIRPEKPDTLYIGGYANNGPGFLYKVGLVRDTAHHVTGFSSDAIPYVAAPNNDGGLFFAPNGTLLFTRYSNNEMGQVLPDGTYRSDPLGPIGIQPSVGSVVLVPSGYPGAGNIIIASYSYSIIYRVPYTIEATGFYTFLTQTNEEDIEALADGPEGIAYIPAGSAGFPNLSMVISSYGFGTVVVYEVGDEGLPIVATGKEMVTGLDGAEGALIDPLTGDFLFSTFGGGDKVVRISGFEKPSGIGDHSMNDLSFRLLQNHAASTVTIQFDGKAKLDGTFMTVCSAAGQQMIFQQLNELNTTIDVSSWPVGVYVVKVFDDKGVKTVKFIR